jgi:predicted phage terminase large subunit-like protein
MILGSEFDDAYELAGRELARRDLREFIRRFWPVVEQSATYRHGWHIDCICEHLQAVKDGQITRLLINIPPRHMKSTLCSVMFPAWYWLDKPESKFLNVSYSQHLSIRDCRKSRNIITHPLYNQLLHNDAEGNAPWLLSSDQNVKSMYANTMTGQRFATSVTGSLTGEGGDIIIVDDPHNVQEVSPRSLEEVHDWWTEAMPTRLNDPNSGVFIVIMQRVHERDLSGVILDGEDKYTHLCLPARYEGENRVVTSLGWRDRRTAHGEPLWPEHYGEAALTRVESTMSSYSKAGQLQQRPAPEKGGIFDEDNFQSITEEGLASASIERSVRYWDKAGTDGGGAYTVGVLVHLLTDGRFVVADVCRGQWSYAKREARMKAVCSIDFDRAGSKRKKYEIHYEQEPGSGGKESAERTRENLLTNKDGTASALTACKIVIDRVTGSKEVRAEPYAVQVENHNVYVLQQPWTAAFIEEHSLFPNGTYKDQIDATAGAVVALTGRRKKAKSW